MNTTNPTTNPLYTPELIQLASVGVEYASLLEQGAELKLFVRGCLMTLPRIYSLMHLLPGYLYDSELDYIEEYVSEYSYERVRERVATILGERDSYLTTTPESLQMSETPILAQVSEQLADVYQHLGNLLGILREENELALPAAIGRCQLYWQEYWGASLLSALRALHEIHIDLLSSQSDEDETLLIPHEDDDN